MATYRLTIHTLTAFGTPLMGDTLFGQICWGIRHQYGNEKLENLLQGYTENKPFLVVSNAMPSGYLPLPTLPSSFWHQNNEIDRKKLKKKKWLNQNLINEPTSYWQEKAVAENEIENFKITTSVQPHNSINRSINTTDDDKFAPFSQSQIWYSKETQLDLYFVLDEDRFSLKELETVLKNIAQLGYGRDANVGLGKFDFKNDDFQAVQLSQKNANCYLTLANCSPFNQNFETTKSFYQLETRFGRHGDIEGLKGQPFKNPIILAKIGAIFKPYQYTEKVFIGRGLDQISHSDPKTVHQGYAPVIGIYLDFKENDNEHLYRKL